MKLGELGSVVLVTALASWGTSMAFRHSKAPNDSGVVALRFDGIESKSAATIVERFSLVNLSDRPMNSLKISPSCGCTTVDALPNIDPKTTRQFTIHINRSQTDSTIPLGLAVTINGQVIHKFVITKYTEVEDYDPSKKYEESDCRVPGT